MNLADTNTTFKLERDKAETEGRMVLMKADCTNTGNHCFQPTEPF